MYAVDCGSWFVPAATYEAALKVAEEVIEEFSNQGHPMGDLWPRQLVTELTPSLGVNSDGEIVEIPVQKLIR
jgi:hypothetical protein